MTSFNTNIVINISPILIVMIVYIFILRKLVVKLCKNFNESELEEYLLKAGILLMSDFTFIALLLLFL